MNARNRLWIGLLLAAVFAAYAPSLANGFALDDPLLAKAVLPEGVPNRMTAELLPLDEYFTANYWKGDGCTEGRLYRPITILSYALTNAMQGGVDAAPATEAVPHHLLNVLLHTWATLLAFLLIRRWIPEFWPAFFGAAVFGLHALHSEVVAGIVGRAELFAFCFGANGLLLAQPGACCRAAAIARGGGAALSLFAAFCSKESAVAWLPFLFVFAFACESLTRGMTARLLAVGLLPLALFLVLRHHAVGAMPDPVAPYLANPLAHVDTATRMATALMLQGFGLWKCLWPIGLASDYGPVTFDLPRSFADIRVLGAAFVLCGWTMTALLLARRHPVLFVANACFVGFSFLVSNIPFAIGTIFGERLFFTPTLALALLVASVAARFPQRWLLVPLFLWTGVSVVEILTNNSAWRDDTHRLARDVETNPYCVRGLDSYARTLRDGGQLAAADAHWRRALQLEPEFVLALNEFGNSLADRQRFAEAESLLRRAVGAPEHYGALRHISRYNLARIHEQRNRIDERDAELRRAWEEANARTAPHRPLIDMTVRALPPDESAAILAAVRTKDPEFEFFAGRLAIRREDWRGAERILRAVVDAQPRHATARYYLAVALRFLDREADSRRELQHLLDARDTPPSIRRGAAKLLK